MDAVAEPLETELKFEVDAEVAAALARSAPFRRAEAEPLLSVYFDTDDFALAKAGFALRIRSEKGRLLQTLKRRGAGSLFSRGEWEAEVAAFVLEPEKLPKDVGLPEAVSCPGDLRPRFSIGVARRAVRVRRRGALLEFALDEGEARCGDKSSPILELEIERLSGDRRRLFDAARALFVHGPLRLSTRAKAAAGYALAAGEPDHDDAETPALTPDMGTGAAFQSIGMACLDHFLRNERKVRLLAAPEAIHQARVALRRLRAAMTLFKAILSDRESQARRAVLGEMARTLGAARDLDVLIGRLEGLSLPPSFDKALLLQAFRDRREAAVRAAVKALSGRKAAQAMFETAAWLECGRWLSPPSSAGGDALAEPVGVLAGRELSRRTRGLRRAGASLAELGPVDRHAVRIRAKKVRYGAEFFLPLAEAADDRKAAQRFIKALKPVQAALGDLNDIAVGERRLRILAETGRDPALAFAAGAAAKALSDQEAALVAQACRAAADFADADAFPL